MTLQGLLQPEGAWYHGRSIMVIRNDKALGVLKGDVGVVLPYASGGEAFFLHGEQLPDRYRLSRLTCVQTAFAVTIHKSQDSDFF